jgi:hypothetical protein
VPSKGSLRVKKERVRANVPPLTALNPMARALLGFNNYLSKILQTP